MLGNTGMADWEVSLLVLIVYYIEILGSIITTLTRTSGLGHTTCSSNDISHNSCNVVVKCS